MRKRSVILLLVISNILISKRGGNIIKLLAKKNISLILRLFIRKAAMIFNKIIIDIIKIGKANFLEFYTKA